MDKGVVERQRRLVVKDNRSNIVFDTRLLVSYVPQFMTLLAGNVSRPGEVFEYRRIRIDGLGQACQKRDLRRALTPLVAIAPRILQRLFPADFEAISAPINLDFKWSKNFTEIAFDRYGLGVVNRKRQESRGSMMRLSVCVLAITVLLSPLAARAQTPADPNAAPAAAPAAPPPPAAAVVVVPATPAAPATAVVVVPAAPAAPPAPTPKLTWGGLIDTYYLYNFIKPDGANSLLAPGGRAFDTNSNSITLALAKVSLNAALDPVAFQLDMGYGSVGTIINNANAGSTATAPFGGSFLIEQAFGTVSLPGNLTLDFGKFVTTAGAEVIEANKNWLYSRSLLFNAIPLLHTGVRANLKINDQLTLQAGIVNGWNNDPDNNGWKTGEVSASITASPMLSIIATTYFGKEAAEGTVPNDLRILVDLVVALTVNDKFGLNLNIDYIKAPDNASADYQIGAALMGRYVISDHLNVAARGEWLRGHSDAGGNLDQEEGTLMVGLPAGKNFEFRPEIRYDHATVPDGGTPFYNGKANQFTAEFAALTYF